jgi:lysozyme family protein
MEYVKLASLSSANFPQREAYAAAKWEEYKIRPARKGRVKESEDRYKAKRRRYWDEIAALRNELSKGRSVSEPV